ncbi:MAG: TraY domain-containing protein [Beijerinckiaceae bacterium]
MSFIGMQKYVDFLDLPYQMLYMYCTLEPPMLALRLPPELEKRLDELARKTGRTKSYYARKAIVEMLEDLEDLEFAKARLAENNARIPLEQILDEFAAELKR